MKFNFQLKHLVYVVGTLLIIWGWSTCNPIFKDLWPKKSEKSAVQGDNKKSNKTQYEEALAKNLANKESAGEVIGEWYDSTPYIEAKIIIIKSGDSYLMKREFKDGSAMEKDLGFSKFKGKSKFSYESSSGSYMVIESSGHLGLYDREGFISTAKKLN